MARSPVKPGKSPAKSFCFRLHRSGGGHAGAAGPHVWPACLLLFRCRDRRADGTVYLAKKSDWSKRAQKELQAGLHYLQECGLEHRPGHHLGVIRPQGGLGRILEETFSTDGNWPGALDSPKLEQAKAKKGQHEIVLDPGLSFGTGQHPPPDSAWSNWRPSGRTGKNKPFSIWEPGRVFWRSPRQSLVTNRWKRLILILKRSGSPRLTRNRTGCSKSLRITRKDLTKIPLKPARQFDVICANLIYDLLVEQKSRIINRLKPGGHLILAGILQTQFAQVSSAFERAGYTDAHAPSGEGVGIRGLHKRFLSKRKQA